MLAAPVAQLLGVLDLERLLPNHSGVDVLGRKVGRELQGVHHARVHIHADPAVKTNDPKVPGTS